MLRKTPLLGGFFYVDFLVGFITANPGVGKAMSQGGQPTMNGYEHWTETTQDTFVTYPTHSEPN